MEGKLTRRISQLKSAVCNFEQSLSIELGLFPEIVKDSIESGQIQKFEVSSELLWKTLKVFLYEIGGTDEKSPKSVIKSFFNSGYCGYEEYEMLMTMINDRNSLSHIYNSEMMQSVRTRLADFLQVMKKCLETVENAVASDNQA
jgi:nucleotidyltransferase substrate binding protein (TIGR01987 family)